MRKCNIANGAIEAIKLILKSHPSNPPFAVIAGCSLQFNGATEVTRLSASTSSRLHFEINQRRRKFDQRTTFLEKIRVQFDPRSNKIAAIGGYERSFRLISGKIDQTLKNLQSLTGHFHWNKDEGSVIAFSAHRQRTPLHRKYVLNSMYVIKQATVYYQLFMS